MHEAWYLPHPIYLGGSGSRWSNLLLLSSLSSKWRGVDDKNCVHRWTFLALHWDKWSDLPKIEDDERTREWRTHQMIWWICLGIGSIVPTRLFTPWCTGSSYGVSCSRRSNGNAWFLDATSFSRFPRIFSTRLLENYRCLESFAFVLFLDGWFLYRPLILLLLRVDKNNLLRSIRPWWQVSNKLNNAKNISTDAKAGIYPFPYMQLKPNGERSASISALMCVIRRETGNDGF